MNQLPHIVFSAVDHESVLLVEAAPGAGAFLTAEDATLLVEACFSARSSRALVYAQTLTPKFFDLSSGEAGAILQKLRNYRMRLAVVVGGEDCSPGTVAYSSRFHEMASEESEKGWFRLFESAPAARQWLAALSS